MADTVVAQLGVAGVTIVIMMTIFFQLRKDVMSEIAQIRSDAKWQAEQLLKLLDNCMDSDSTAQAHAQLERRFHDVPD